MIIGKLYFNLHYIREKVCKNGSQHGDTFLHYQKEKLLIE